MDNTLDVFKDALETMVETYGNCLCSDVKKSGLEEELETFIEAAAKLWNKLDEVI